MENPFKIDNPAPEWMANNVWNRLCELGKIESKFKLLVKNFEEDEDMLRKIAESDHPLREEFPKCLGVDGFKYNTFSKLCIIKVLKPDKLIQSIKEYVIEEMGEEFVTPPSFDIKHSFNDSSNTTPLIFVLPGADPL